MYNMLQEWENYIYDLTSQSKIHDKYMNILKKQMQEIKNQYYKMMHNMAIYRIIAIKYQNIYNEDSYIISLYKREREYLDRNILVTKFSRNRCAIAKQYYLSHRLIKNIVIKAHLFLPDIFCDFGRYHNLEFIDFDKYINALLKKY